jgi:hypothetical protein
MPGKAPMTLTSGSSYVTLETSDATIHNKKSVNADFAVPSVLTSMVCFVAEEPVMFEKRFRN